MKRVQRVPFLKTRSLKFRSHRMPLDQPAGPPPEGLDEIDAAWERAQALVVGKLELVPRAFGEQRRPDVAS